MKADNLENIEMLLLEEMDISEMKSISGGEGFAYDIGALIGFAIRSMESPGTGYGGAKAIATWVYQYN